MIRITEAPSFQRSYKSLIQGRPHLEKTFRERLLLFIANPYNPRLATHKLKGKLKQSWAYSLNFSLRVVFRFEEDDVVVLENIGPHADVY